ncbi:MAG: RNA polymerase sigma factor [Bacteroidota bacterium]
MNSVDFVDNFNALESKLYAFAFKLTKDESRAKDLVQEAAFKAYKNLARFKPGTNFKAWISTILRNTFINNYRRKKVRNITSEPVSVIMHKVDSEQYTDNEGTVNVETQELHSIIQDLKPKYRKPFIMQYRGYEYSEIAEAMDIPVGTVKSRLFVARKKLQAAVRSRYAIAV